jgi:hypothetical protein
MQPYDIKKMKAGFWVFCAMCDKQGLAAYAYTPQEARDHMVTAHNRTQDYVNNWWPD